MTGDTTSARMRSPPLISRVSLVPARGAALLARIRRVPPVRIAQLHAWPWIAAKGLLRRASGLFGQVEGNLLSVSFRKGSGGIGCPAFRRWGAT
jgi:hypothetical protein